MLIPYIFKLYNELHQVSYNLLSYATLGIWSPSKNITDQKIKCMVNMHLHFKIGFFNLIRNLEWQL
jgi:hypothetical protein